MPVGCGADPVSMRMFLNRALAVAILAMGSLAVFPSRSPGALGNVTGLSWQGDRLMIAVGADTLAVRVWRTNLIEVDYRPLGHVQPVTDIIGQTNGTSPSFAIDTNADPIRISTTAMVVEIGRAPCRLRVYDGTGTNLLVREPAAEGVFADGLRLTAKEDSDFYGIHAFYVWDNTTPRMLRNTGGFVEAGYQGDGGAPMVWSRQGYGLLVDSDGGQFTISGTNLTFDYCSKTNVLYYIATGPPEDVLAAFFELSGRPPMLPKYAMGFANTEWGITQSELTNIVAGYRQRQIPIDHYILDFDWKAWGEDNYGEWRWNTGKFPDGPSGALRTNMAARGIHLSGIMKPRIHVNTAQGAYATASNYWWPGQSTYNDYFSGQPVKDLNFARADARAWFFDHITNAFATGIRGWWNDEADQAGGGGILFGNWQFLNMQKALYEGQRSVTSQRVWSINRNFYLGSQRYAYAMWSGDIDGGFANMARERERMLSSINVGAVKWGMDIGGFNNGGLTTSECYARWMQFGAFVPVYRVHGQENNQRQPWVYGATAEAVAKAAIELRYRLLPYIYSCERASYETGLGLVRPLVYRYPDDDAVANYVEAWMFGPDLLVSPVVTAGATSQSIYLPEGTWYDYFRGTAYNGRQTLTYAINSSTWTDLPLFVRSGAILPTQPVLNFVGERAVTNLAVDVFPAWQPSSFTLYDDDGETYAYEAGAWFKQEMSAVLEDGRAVFALAAPAGPYAPAVQQYLCRIHAPTGHAVTLDGAPLFHYDDAAAFSNGAAEGWVSSADRFGPVTLVRVAAQAARTIVISNDVVQPPTFAPDGGVYAGPVELTIQHAHTGATLRFTLNGADPDETSPVYTTPFVVWTTTTVRARAYVPGRSPSTTASTTLTIDENQLLNPGFEQQGATTNHPLYWHRDDPDQHGEVWGSAGRVAWRSHGGSWECTIRGTWAGLGTTGGFWQERPALPGRTYTFSSWFWADSTWSASRQGLKIEFLSGQPVGTNYLQATTSTFSGVGQTWTQKAMSATAPAGAEWVRVVIFAEGAGANGALQFDDLRLDPLGAVPLTVSSDHGSPIPPTGTHLYNLGSVLTNSVEEQVSLGGTQFLCTGWSMAGNDPQSGTGHTMTMTLTNGALLTWTWITNTLPPSVVSFESAAYSVSETSTVALLRVLRTGGTAGVVQVHFTTQDGTAHSNEDYAAAGGVLTFDDGQDAVDLAIPLADDLLFEADEDLTVLLHSPSGQTTIAPPDTAQVTLVNDDPDLGNVTLSVLSEHGQAAPPSGVHTQAYGTMVTCRLTNALVEAGTQYVGAGWTGSGSVPASGASNSTPPLALTGDSTIAWMWTTNVAFVAAAGANGSIGGADSGWYPHGASVTVDAVALSQYLFNGWTGDVTEAEASANPLVLAMDRSKSVTATFRPAVGSNLLNNGSFEQAGLTADVAAYWKLGDPDEHGHATGTALRVSWRATDGAWEGTIRGTWSGAGNSGAFWQEVPAHEGLRYKFSASFWADDGNPNGPWTAGQQHLGLEFLARTVTGDVVLAANYTALAANQAWSLQEVAEDAPAGAEWVRVVIAATNVSTDGALQFDDLKLEAIPLLSAPELLPASGTNSTSFTAGWNAVEEATGYLVDLATNAGFAGPQYAGDLFISEYAEGSGASNRYIEIYNGTGSSRDLAGYRVWRISNGGSWPESELSLTGILPHGTVYVIRASTSTDSQVVERAHLSTASAVMAFTGDDAMGLARLNGSSYALIDAVGSSGADPGTGWGVGGVADGTFDHTLVRKPAQQGGNPDWSTCSNEWVVLPANTFSNIGEHAVSWAHPGDLVPSYTLRPVGPATSLTVTGLWPGVTYYLRVRATNAAVDSPYSDPLAVLTRAYVHLFASAGPHGAITPTGDLPVAVGADGAFVVTADAYHHITAVTTNGAPLPLPGTTALWSVTWSNVWDDGAIHAEFGENVTSQGTPEWWLAQHFGDTNYEDAAGQDGDGDGIVSWQEFEAGTDPTNVASFLALGLSEGTNGSALTFLAATGRTYQLQVSTDLVEAAWQPMPEQPDLPGDGEIHTIPGTNSEPQRLYRLRVMRP